MSREELARRQAQLVAALVAGADPPPGFDESRVRATATALLTKRAGEVGERWPALRGQFGPRWRDEFAQWAQGRAPRGSWRDGWDFARHLARDGRLHPAAAADLAAAEACYRYEGVNPPRRRRLPALRRVQGTLALQIAGRVRVF